MNEKCFGRVREIFKENTWDFLKKKKKLSFILFNLFLMRPKFVICPLNKEVLLISLLLKKYLKNCLNKLSKIIKKIIKKLLWPPKTLT